MPEYAGSALYLQWVTTSGTVTLHGDSRSFSTSPSVDIYETSAGSDTHKGYLPGIKDQTMQVGIVAQADGTVILTQVREGMQGTLFVGPEGTATGKIKETYPAISMGPGRTQPYNNIVEYSITFQQNGAPTYAAW